MKRAAIGIVGGFCPLAVADIYLKAMKQVKAVRGDYDYPDIIISAALEQKVRGDWFDDSFERRYDMSHRSLYIYQVARELKSRGVDKILVPDFLSCNFIKTISNNLEIPFIDIVEVIACEVKNKWPRTSRVGLLAATLAIESKVFNTKFAAKGLEIIYPDKDVQENMIMKAVYGPAGLKRGIIDKRPGKLIHRACEHLLTKGAEIIVSGITELPLIDKAYYPENRYLDCNDVIAGELINNKYIIKSNLEKRRIIGILGGVGPAATVDIFDKIVKNTPAVKDQDHLKIIIENNPQIPDRTAALYDKGEDPGIAILAGAEKLQDAGADFVIVPCNTAHVFLEKIQKHIRIPVLSMIEETVGYIAENFPNIKKAGLLASTGTVSSGIYEEALNERGIELIIPSSETQEKFVMEAVYGEKGIKAGFKEGKPRFMLLKAAEELIKQGVQIIILGCTEIPLVLKNGDADIPFIDANEILAKAAVRQIIKE